MASGLAGLLLYSTFETHRHNSARVNKRKGAGKEWETHGGLRKKKAGLDEGSREEVRRAEKQEQGKNKEGNKKEGRKKGKEVRESVPGMNIKM